MATLPGLFQRGGVYQLRTIIPLDLRHAYGGKSKVVHSLKTADNREARVTGTAMRAAMLAEFEQKRREAAPSRPASITPALAETLAQRVYASVLAADDAIRGRPEVAQALLSVVRNAAPPKLTIPTGKPGGLPDYLRAPVDPLDGLTDELRRDLMALHGAMNADAATAQATQRLRAVLPMVEAEARRIGLEFDANTPGAKEALRLALKAYRTGRDDVARRDAGVIVDTPDTTLPPPSDTAAKLTLRDVFGKWKVAELRKEQSTRANELALEDFEAWAGQPAPTIDRITRAQGVEFKSWLLKKVEAGDYSSKTAHTRMVNVCSLLKFAHQDLELLERQPWRGLKIDYRTEAPRRPWPDEAVSAFLALPLFQTYALPRTTESGHDAAYWLPLLGLYTGATVSELAQLQTADVERGADGSALVHFTEEAEGQQLKTEQRSRVVPVHSELIRLGFLDYVKAMKDMGHASLWPKLRKRKGKPGAHFSTWFGEVRKTVEGVTVPDFHSLRHTVRSQMTEAGLDANVQDHITGHGIRGSAGVRVYTHPKAILRKAVESISYPWVKLPRCYPAKG